MIIKKSLSILLLFVLLSTFVLAETKFVSQGSETIIRWINDKDCIKIDEYQKALARHIDDLKEYKKNLENDISETQEMINELEGWSNKYNPVTWFLGLFGFDTNRERVSVLSAQLVVLKDMFNKIEEEIDATDELRIRLMQIVNKLEWDGDCKKQQSSLPQSIGLRYDY